MSKSVLRKGPWLRRELYHHFCVSQFQPLSRWIMILGLVESLESLTPEEAEWRIRAML